MRVERVTGTEKPLSDPIHEPLAIESGYVGAPACANDHCYFLYSNTTFCRISGNGRTIKFAGMSNVICCDGI